MLSPVSVCLFVNGTTRHRQLLIKSLQSSVEYLDITQESID